MKSNSYCYFQWNFNLISKSQIWYIEITNLSQFPTNVPKSHPQPHCTLQLASYSSQLIVTFLYARSSTQNDRQQFVLRITPYFVHFELYPTPQNKNLTELCLQILTLLSRQPFRIRHVIISTRFWRWPLVSHLKYWPFLMNHPALNLRTFS